jgi:hypothetical protein
LYVVPVAFGEEGPKRTVGEAGRQGGLGAGAPLSSEEAARDLADRVEPLLVVYGEGKEVDAFPGRGAGASRDQDDGIAEPDGYGASGLERELAHFNG